MSFVVAVVLWLVFKMGFECAYMKRGKNCWTGKLKSQERGEWMEHGSQSPFRD